VAAIKRNFEGVEDGADTDADTVIDTDFDTDFPISLWILHVAVADK